ncbi:hypothetical protein D1872_203900 [compost metagenome]
MHCHITSSQNAEPAIFRRQNTWKSPVRSDRKSLHAALTQAFFLPCSAHVLLRLISSDAEEKPDYAVTGISVLVRSHHIANQMYFHTARTLSQAFPPLAHLSPSF